MTIPQLLHVLTVLSVSALQVPVYQALSYGFSCISTACTTKSTTLTSLIAGSALFAFTAFTAFGTMACCCGHFCDGGTPES